MSVASNKQYNLHFEKWEKESECVVWSFLRELKKTVLKNIPTSLFQMKYSLFLINCSLRNQKTKSLLVIYKKHQKVVKKFQPLDQVFDGETCRQGRDKIAEFFSPPVTESSTKAYDCCWKIL